MAESIEHPWRKGMIRRIRLKNFMTYDDVEFFPSSRVNMIIGPNGSGKSSVACAVCLVLCGLPKHIGRGKEMKSFIKTGHESAELEAFCFLLKIYLTLRKAEIYDDERSHPTIMRTIFISGVDEDRVSHKRKQSAPRGSSIWHLNGSITTEKSVRELVRHYNLQGTSVVDLVDPHYVCSGQPMSVFATRQSSGIL
jgi:chromosome segregation ATPase